MATVDNSTSASPGLSHRRIPAILGGGGLRGSRRRTAGLMLTPWLLGFVGFLLGPLIASLVLAFTVYNIFTPPRWIGLGNVREMWSDPAFAHAWKVTLIYGLAGTAYMLVLALATALMIYHARSASGFWRVLYYFPALLGGASEAYVMLAVWTPDYGLTNSALRLFGIHGPGWLASPHWALPAVILMRYWTIGTMMLLFLGARASVSSEYYEAARVDGARPLQRFRYVTLPMMSPIILVNVILGIIGSLQAFSQIFILTRGGPLDATELIGLYIYREAFLNIRMGYGSAVSWSLFLVTLAITLILLLSSRWWVYYEEGETL
jgi:multiple sugar transport system permease protein